MPNYLYPTTTIALENIQGLNLLNSSSLLLVPIIISSGIGITLSMEQVAPTQDYSMRSWISLLGDGNFYPTNTSFWYLPRIISQLVLVYDFNFPVPVGNYLTIPVPPGNYLLNILNLVNAQNYFGFTSTILAL